MEGMVSVYIIWIQNDFADFSRCSLSFEIWANGLVMKLPEITHGQWLYKNMQVHNAVSGLKVAKRKEGLQREMGHQMLLGGTGLGEKDR